MNWRENDHHHHGAISFGYFVKRVCSKVVNEIAECGYLEYNFIPHSALSYNASTNTQYLQDDCLYFRVKEVALYSTPAVPLVPSWHDPTCPFQSVFEFTLSEFSKRKQFNNTYCSVPFYTHMQGYKMQLRVDANREKHVSTHLFLNKGEYDDTLQWPLYADIEIQLLNWKQDNHHHRFLIHFNETAGDDVHGRLMSTEGAYKGWGTRSFIHHSALSHNTSTNTQYLKDDCLRFQVKAVAFYTTSSSAQVPSWQNPTLPSHFVCEFTLNEFSKRKQFNNQYYSTPFYSHLRGYKLQLNVSASTESFVSVYLYLNKGEYDENLQWPFRANIEVQLLNWREDRHHHKYVIHFNEKAGDDVCGRVMRAERASVGWGTQSFIDHSALFYNSTTKTQYVQDDCLRFRVKRVGF